MHIHKINKPIFDFSPTHPAREFLEAFVQCRKHCVGCELSGIDQEWFSEKENRLTRFSSFAYEWLSFDVELDGWLTNAPCITEAEQRSLEAALKMEALMGECKEAAMKNQNQAVILLCNEVLGTIELWCHAINYRLS